MVYFAFGKIFSLALEAHMRDTTLKSGLCTSLSIVQSPPLESFQRFDFQGKIGACPTAYEGFICKLAFIKVLLKVQCSKSPLPHNPTMQLICPPKLCTSIVFNFSLGTAVIPRRNEKKKRLCKVLGANKVQYAWEMWKWCMHSSQGFDLGVGGGWVKFWDFVRWSWW